MIGVERIGVGVGDEHVGGELANRLGDRGQRLACRSAADSRRGPEQRTSRRDAGRRARASAWRMRLTFSHRLALLLPQLAGLAALAVGQRDHLAPAAERAALATAPPARHTKSAACAPITCTAGSCAPRPPARRVFCTAIVRTSSVAEARRQEMIGHDAPARPRRAD